MCFILTLFKKFALYSFEIATSTSSILLLLASIPSSETSSSSPSKAASPTSWLIIKWHSLPSSSHLLTLLFGTLNIITAINVILQFICILNLFRINWVIWLSQLFISMCKVALLTKSTVLMSLVVSASLSFILIIYLSGLSLIWCFWVLTQISTSLMKIKSIRVRRIYVNWSRLHLWHPLVGHIKIVLNKISWIATHLLRMIWSG